jgi:hypothetical protein
MWWIDVLALALVVVAWVVVARWVAFTSGFYRRRGADFGNGHPVTVALRGAFILIAVFATADLIRRLA